MFMQMPLPAPHGSASHSFTSEEHAQAGRRQRGPGKQGHPGHPPAPLTHAVVVLRVRPVARVAMAGVTGGTLDALPVATDVLVEPTLVCLCGPRWGVWGWQVRKLSREHSLSAMSPVRTSVPHS